MAESTLSTSLDDIRKAIAHPYGAGIDPDKWTDEQIEVIDMILKRGLRQFYFPPKIYGDEEPHEWNFLKPITTLGLVGSYSTGTIAITKTDKTVTITGGVWPSWAATHGTLVVDNAEYAIASRTSDTEIELVDAWTEDSETEAKYTLRHDGDYDLPDDFGGIEGKLTFEPSLNLPPMVLVNEGKIRSLRSGQHSTRDYPVYAAIRPKEQTDTTKGQRFEIMFFPIPALACTIYYKKLILPEMLADTTITYPYGGAMHAETIEASCLAIMEMQEEEKRGEKWEYFKERLAASIRIDKVQCREDYFGYNGDNSDMRYGNGSDERPVRKFLVTYKGNH